MNKPLYARRLVAWCAAYVVALQALLLPLSLAVANTVDLSLCVTASKTDGTPASHPTSCPCAAGCGMQCCVHASNGVTQAASTAADLQSGVIVPPPDIILAAQPHDLRRPQIPRAPPAS